MSDGFDSRADLVSAPQEPDGPVGVEEEPHLKLDRGPAPTNSPLVHFLDERLRDDVLPCPKRGKEGGAIVSCLLRDDNLYRLVLAKINGFERFEYAVLIFSFNDFAQNGTSFNPQPSIHELRIDEQGIPEAAQGFLGSLTIRVDCRDVSRARTNRRHPRRVLHWLEQFNDIP